jgi:RNA polymerase sigma-70 factor (ECF subfamily)
MNHTERDELLALKGGCSKAFEALYNRYAGKLYHFMMKLTNGDSWMAEEMVQTAFVKLWEVREQIRPEEPVISFLATIAKNNLLNHYKRQTVELFYRKMMEENLTECDDSPMEELEEIWLERYVDDLTEQLPQQRKKIFRMSHREHLLNREIADKLGVSVSTVQTQISLARKFMKKAIPLLYAKKEGSFCGVAHHQHGLTQSGGFFLNATAVGEHQRALLHQKNKWKILQRLDKEDIPVAIVSARYGFLAEDLQNGLAHVGIDCKCGSNQ